MEILAEYKSTVYKSDENGYCVFRYRDRDKNESIICTGTSLPEHKNLTYLLVGDWTSNPKYGAQFKVVSHEIQKPEDKNAIVAYLSCGLIKGIGKKLAESIYKTFGKESISVIESTPEQLMKIRGISEKKLQPIVQSIKEGVETRELTMFFIKHGLSLHIVKEVYSDFHELSMHFVRRELFSLNSVYGVGFQSVNQISLTENICVHDQERIFAAANYVLKEQIALKGHLYVGTDYLLKQVMSVLNQKADQSQKVSDVDVKAALNEMFVRQMIHIERGNNGSRVYHHDSYMAEKDAAFYLSQRINQSSETFSDDAIADAIAQSENKMGLMLNQRQKDAVSAALRNNVSIITGGPGTGKTTTLKVLLEAYRLLNDGNYIMLAAPTGRAARKMSEVADGIVAQTIHSMLQIRPDDEYAESIEVEADFLVVDESSMIDMWLFTLLLRRLPNSTKLLLIGDKDQLPSVGAGNVLAELLTCGEIPVTYLNEIYRQEGDSTIISNIFAVNAGNTDLVYANDFVLLERHDSEHIAKTIVDLFIEEVVQYGNLDKVQIISPYRERGVISTQSLNNAIQARINSGKEGIKVRNTLISVGDKVIQQKNTNEVKNGDMGYVQRYAVIDNVPVLIIEFECGKTCSYDHDALMNNKVTLAYAITVHKSQGSEFDSVIMPVSMEHSGMLKRNLFYTAISRGKKKVSLIGSKAAINKAIKDNDIEGRNTALGRRIVFYMDSMKNSTKTVKPAKEDLPDQGQVTFYQKAM